MRYDERKKIRGTKSWPTVATLLVSQSPWYRSRLSSYSKGDASLMQRLDVEAWRPTISLNKWEFLKIGDPKVWSKIGHFDGFVGFFWEVFQFRGLWIHTDMLIYCSWLMNRWPCVSLAVTTRVAFNDCTGFALVEKVEISRWMLKICVWKVQHRDIFL